LAESLSHNFMDDYDFLTVILLVTNRQRKALK
jgi:hypothetical protein